MSMSSALEASVQLTDDVRGVLLAGGRSKRMGRDKRLLSTGDKPFVLHAYRALSEAFGPPWVLVAADQDVLDLSPILGASAHFVIDRMPGAGPLSALAHVLGEVDRPLAFLLAADMPRVTSVVLGAFERLRRELDREPEVLAPRTVGLVQVTCAFYRQSLAAGMLEAVHAGETCLAGWVRGSSVDSRYVEGDELEALGGTGSFENVNTPADHTRYLRRRSYVP